MKKILLYAAFLAIAFTAKAQTNTKYDTCNTLHQYEGEWRYVNGQDTIRIYLRVNRTFDNSSYNYISDDLWGWHEYKKGNKIIESDYQHRFMQLAYSSDTMFDSSSITLCQKRRACSSLFVDLTGFIKDYNQARQTKNVTAKFNSSGTTMTWHQEHAEGYGFGNGKTGMTLPKNFVLIKQ